MNLLQQLQESTNALEVAQPTAHKIILRYANKQARVRAERALQQAGWAAIPKESKRGYFLVIEVATEATMINRNDRSELAVRSNALPEKSSTRFLSYSAWETKNKVYTRDLDLATPLKGRLLGDF